MDAEKTELVALYLARLGDAGTTIVLGMFGLAFATYAILATSPPAWALAYTYRPKLYRLAFIGNGFLLGCLLTLGYMELHILDAASNAAELKSAAITGVVMRTLLFLGNFGFYIRVLSLIQPPPQTTTEAAFVPSADKQIQ